MLTAILVAGLLINKAASFTNFNDVKSIRCMPTAMSSRNLYCSIDEPRIEFGVKEKFLRLGLVIKNSSMLNNYQICGRTSTTLDQKLKSLSNYGSFNDYFNQNESQHNLMFYKSEDLKSCNVR